MTGSGAHLVGQRSRSRIAPFRLHRPSTLDQAIELMASAPAGAAYMAGGIDVIERMKAGWSPGEIVHLGCIPALARIDACESGLAFGACATHRAVSESEIVQRRAPALACRWRGLANPRVRHKGTLGGNVMSGESTYDATLMFMAAGATLVYAAEGGLVVRSPIANGAAPEGLLTSIEVSAPEQLELRIDRSLHPALTLVCGFRYEGAHVAGVRVAIGGAYEEPRVFLLEVGEPASARDLSARADALVETLLADLPIPRTDWHASALYRQRMIAVLLRRLLAEEGLARC